MNSRESLQELKLKLQGDLYFDNLMRGLYATDASVYRKIPLAVAIPKNVADLKLIVKYANANTTTLIPRTAGTSLAGQCVGDGIVVDVSKHFTKILSIDAKGKTVTVQPGVVRDELNAILKPYGLFFGPNTSTSNRCMIGGMVGNNSSGTTSIRYGVTRDKVICLKVILSDGSEATFEPLDKSNFFKKTEQNNLEGRIYKSLYHALSPKQTQEEIKTNFPKDSIHRRNTGYAIDELIKSIPFSEEYSGTKFNMCQLLAGSEGTLAFTTEITLALDSLPPSQSAMVAMHFNSVENCLKAVKTAMTHNLYTCEMMDDTILNLTKYNKTQEENRKFIVDNPAAILMCELKSDSLKDLNIKIERFLASFAKTDLSYAQPVLRGVDIIKALELRKAGLGLLGNMIGDKKAVACIEDTAVALEDLEPFISEFTSLMAKYDQKAVYYAHAGAGELHLRPILDLKEQEDVVLFRKITTEVAKLVKKYRGSMSGEHGDGIVRAEFIPMIIGASNYELLKEIKKVFDPNSIFNQGKIVNPYPMDKNLRYEPEHQEPTVDTLLDFSESLGILREAEKCNGSGDCRKLPQFGGTMCPSYRATRNEKDTTRARANALREFLTHSEKQNRFNHQELKEVFDLCLSCKACSSECPSSVDVSTLKAEFQYQYQRANGISIRTKLFAYNNAINETLSYIPRISNFIFTKKWTQSVVKRVNGIALERSLPLLSTKSLYKQFQSIEKQLNKKKFIKEVYLFNDEFTNHLESQIGLDVVMLLTRLNYKVNLVEHKESGRAMISKGLLKQAKTVCNTNIEIFKDIISEKTPLLGIEPSAILTFKDEYLKLADNKEASKAIAANTFLIEEFISSEIRLGHINANQFTKEKKVIKFHGHCHQKALANQKSSFDILNLPENYKVTIIPSGCCGMAGSFGYEKEHYKVSMAIGEQTLFPVVRKSHKSTEIAANGTSCRHQIKDGTGRIAKHPATILYEALK